MIKFYYSGETNATRLCESWLNSHQLPFEKIRFSKMTRQDLFEILSKTDKGLTDILKNIPKNQDLLHYLNTYNKTTNYAVSLLLSEPYRLHDTLIVDGNRFLSGYSLDEMRMLIPRKQRELSNEMHGFYAWGNVS